MYSKFITFFVSFLAQICNFELTYFTQLHKSQEEFNICQNSSWKLIDNTQNVIKNKYLALDKIGNKFILLHDMSWKNHDESAQAADFDVGPQDYSAFYIHQKLKKINFSFFTKASLIEISEYVNSIIVILYALVFDFFNLNKTTNLYLYFLLILVIIILAAVLIMLIKNRQVKKIHYDIIDILAHEINTPLTSIKLLSDIIRKKNYISEEKLKQYAAIIYQESERLIQNATQILQSSYYNLSEVQLKLRYHSINGIIQHFINNYQSIYENKISFHANLQAIESVTKIDRNYFIGVLINLLENAKKYCNSDLPVIQIRTYNTKNKINIEFSDNGKGIPLKYHKIIFKRFYSVPQKNQQNRLGFGIGLYYVKIVLEKMNASIYIKSEETKGTTFIIIFKIQKPPVKWQKKNPEKLAY